MKAVVLYSGGLDSSLVIVLTKELGATVFPLHVTHCFLTAKDLPKVKNLKTIDASNELIEIVRSPQFGYGKNLNPCVDCRILMLKKAKEYLSEVKGDFIVTGEVLDQRPMSQRLDTLMLIDKKAQVEGLVVRPLSGGLLPETLAEKNGLIMRADLLKIKGRSRRMTMEMAQQKNVKEYFSPSGGCLLTDSSFARRLADLMRFQQRIDFEDIELLKIGRHFRLSPETKLVVGRNENENKKIEDFVGPHNVLLYVPDIGSPNAILIGDRKLLKTAAAIIARYSDKSEESHIEVHYNHKNTKSKMPVTPITDQELVKWRI